MSQEEKLKMAEFTGQNEPGPDEMLMFGIREYIKKWDLNEALAAQITQLPLKKLRICLGRVNTASDKAGVDPTQLKDALLQLILLDWVLIMTPGNRQLLVTNPQEFGRKIALDVQQNPQLAYYVNQCKFLRGLIRPVEKISKRSAASRTVGALIQSMVQILIISMGGAILFAAVFYLLSVIAYPILYGVGVIPGQISTIQFFWMPQVIGIAGLTALSVAVLFIGWLIRALYRNQSMKNKLWSFFSMLFFPLTFIFVVIPTYFWVNLFFRYPDYKRDEFCENNDIEDLFEIVQIVFNNFNFLTVIKQELPLALNLSQVAELYQQLPAEMKLHGFRIREKMLGVEERYLEAQLDQLKLEVNRSIKTENKAERDLISSLDFAERRKLLSDRLDQISVERCIITSEFRSVLQPKPVRLTSRTLRCEVVRNFQSQRDIIIKAAAAVAEYISEKDKENLKMTTIYINPTPVAVATSATPLLRGATTTDISSMVGGPSAVVDYGAVAINGQLSLDACDEKRAPQSTGSPNSSTMRFLGNAGAVQSVGQTNRVTSSLSQDEATFEM